MTDGQSPPPQVTDGPATDRFAVLTGYAALIAVLVVLFSPVISNSVRAVDGQTDTKIHLRLAAQLAASGEIEAPHPLFHALVAVGIKILGSPRVSGSLVLLLTTLMAGSVIHHWLRESLPMLDSRYRPLVLVACTVCVLLATPITVFTWSARNLYFGYIGMATYHSPTMALLKPLALLLVVILAKHLDHRQRSAPIVSSRTRLGVAALTVGATLAKPSYTICLLPALVILLAFRRSRHDMWILTTVAIPASVVLACQFIFRFFAVDSETLGATVGIGWTPLAVMAVHSTHLAPKALLSVCFPTYVLIAYRRKALQDAGLVLSWLAFVFGFFYTYFLAEIGSRGTLSDGNFVWSGQITLFLLFVATARVFLAEEPEPGDAAARRRYWAGLTIFGLHAVSGLLFFSVSFLGQGRAWW